MTVELTGSAPAYDGAALPEAGHPTRCVWCGAALNATTGRLRGRIRCSACGSATTDPWPTEVELEAAYGGWYRPKRESWEQPNEGGRRFSMAGDAILNRTRGLLAARLDEIAPPGPVLDVGAGEGTLVDALAARGREAVGLERGSARADFIDAAIEQVGGDGTWAAVVLWHSLEHLPRPGAAIAAAARLLKHGGVVAIAVPNNASLQAGAFGDEWLHLDLPRHLVHLTDRSLREGLVANGFSVERTSYARGGQIVVGWLDGLVGALPGGLDLYMALRRSEARAERLPPSRRALSIAAGVALLPLAAICAFAELMMRRGGTVYVEARMAPEPDQIVEASGAKVVVVMPARQAAATLKQTVSEIPLEHVAEIILVDDSSTDETVELARTLPLEVIWHPHQVGYGGNQKTCYMQALQHDADVVVMLHPDGQYEPGLIPEMVAPIIAGEADLVLGSRLAIPGAAIAAGMPRWKWCANRFLTTIQNAIMGTHLTEAHTGYRAYSRQTLLTVPFLRNALDFSFDSEFLYQAAELGLRIEEVPARCRYFEDMSSVGFQTGVTYGLKTVWAGVRLLLHRAGWRSKKYLKAGAPV